MSRDRWEEGFDEWTPPRTAAGAGDTAAEPDRESLLRLARELAEQRQSSHGQGNTEVEQLKQTLRERAEAIAARERELAELERRLGAGKSPKPRRQEQRDAVSLEAVVARERAALERSQALDARERELQGRQADLAAEAERVGERERQLAAELAVAQAQRGESESERQLATAERERLEEREQETRRIEKELAARRIELEAERQRLEDGGLPARGELAAEPADGPAGERERELRRLEARLESRERELALMRQGLDAERNALLDRERALRRREIAEVRQSFEPPLAPPNFSEGLASFVRERSASSRKAR